MKLTRLNNISGSYTATVKGVKYEIVNFHKEDPRIPSEWQVVEWDTGWGVEVFSTLKECREFLATL